MRQQCFLYLCLLFKYLSIVSIATSVNLNWLMVVLSQFLIRLKRKNDLPLVAELVGMLLNLLVIRWINLEKLSLLG